MTAEATRSTRRHDTVSIGVVPLVETNVPLLAFALGAGITSLVALVIVIVQGVHLGKPDEKM